MLKPIAAKTSYGPGAAAFLLGIVVSVLIAWQIDKTNSRKLDASLADELNFAVYKVAETFELYEYGLRGMRGLVLASGDSLSREKITSFSSNQDIAQKFAGARGFGFIRRVPPLATDRFLAMARSDGWPEFKIRELAPNPGERFVIQYIEPVANNLQAVGLDIASELRRKSAALLAMRTGQTQLTAPITLVQATGSPKQAFLMLMPVYAGGATPQSPSEREAKAIGWSYAPLVMEEILATSPLDPSKFHLTLSDITDAGGRDPFYTNGGHAHTSRLYSHAAEREIFGRKWRIEVHAGSAFAAAAALTSPASVLALGALLSLLLSGLILTATQARQRKAELRSKTERLATIVRESPDAILARTAEGIVTDWNPAARNLFGYTSAEAVGRRLTDLIIPNDRWAEEASILRSVVKQQRIQHLETQRRTKGGRVIHVSIAASPILDVHENVIGVSCILRDISRRIADDARIRELNASLEAQVQQRTSEFSRINALFASVLGAATRVAIIATDSQGSITLFNAGAERLLGYSAAEMLGVTPALFHLESEVIARGEELTAEYSLPVSGFRVFVHKAEHCGADVREWTYVRKDGSHVPVSLTVTTITDEHGVITGYLGVAKDISERLAAQQQLAASLATTQAILDTAMNPVFTLDRSGGLCSFNTAGERLFGLPASEAIGRPLSALLVRPAPDELARILGQYWADDAADTSSHVLEALAQRADGSTFPAQLSLGSQVSGGERMAVGVLTDLSLLHAQRAELSSAHDQLRMAADVAELGVWTWDLASDVLHWNDRMFELYDWPEALQEHGLTYEHWRSRVHPDDVVETETRLRGAVEGRMVYDSVFRIVRKNGQVRFIQAGAQVERDASGRAVRVTGINRDISAQRELETRLRVAKEQADAASAAKSTFLANMSHEIRTPMNAVLGMLQLMEQTELSDRQHDYVGKARGAANALLGLLNDILDYSKIEAGKLQLDIHAFALEEVLANLAVVLAGVQGEKDVEVMFDVDAELPRQLTGDSFRLQQVLINLAGNALKFTERGTVQVSVEAIRREDQAVLVRFAVSDTGIGISADQQARIFQGFTQAEASTSRRFGGTGLGLVISRRLVAMMGSALQLESAPGHGSRFWFELWLEVADPAPVLPARDLHASPLHVLVVEDNALAADVIVRMVAAMGWQVERVGGGRAAVLAVQQAQEQGHKFDLILMDWRMPDLDGLSAARLIRQTCPRTADVPLVVMVTAHDREMLIASAGGADKPFVDCLTKPVTPQQLLTTIRRAFEGEVGKSATQAVRPRRLAGLHVLVVDDNALNRQIASEFLTGEGASVTLAEGGLQGVEAVLAATRTFDAVLMDMQMPDIDGLEATARIRAQARFADLPIIAMTANASPADRDACLAAGMNDHIAKPIDLTALVSTVLQRTGRSTTAASAEAIEPSGQATEPLPSILRRFGGNLALYRDMQRGFAGDQRALLDELRASISSKDAARARRVLHTMKGNAATMGARGLSARAADLERLVSTEGNDARDIALVLPPAIIAELEALVVDSDRLLEAAVQAESLAPRASEARQVDLEVWRDGLLALQPLLESGNMRALEIAEAWPPLDDLACAEEARKLLEQVRVLDFPAATDTVRSMLESL